MSSGRDNKENIIRFQKDGMQSDLLDTNKLDVEDLIQLLKPKKKVVS